MKRISLLIAAFVLSMVFATNVSAQNKAGGKRENPVNRQNQLEREETNMENPQQLQVVQQETSDLWDDKVYDVVEQMPAFPGGQSALFSWIAKNMKYPPVAEENGIQGRVVVTCVIDHDGSVTDVKVVKGVDPSLDKEALRLVKSMPKWEPGRQNGKTVRVKYSIPLSFSLQ